MYDTLQLHKMNLPKKIVLQRYTQGDEQFPTDKPLVVGVYEEWKDNYYLAGWLQAESEEDGRQLLDEMMGRFEQFREEAEKNNSHRESP